MSNEKARKIAELSGENAKALDALSYCLARHSAEVLVHGNSGNDEMADSIRLAKVAINSLTHFLEQAR